MLNSWRITVRPYTQRFDGRRGPEGRHLTCTAYLLEVFVENYLTQICPKWINRESAQLKPETSSTKEDTEEPHPRFVASYDTRP